MASVGKVRSLMQHIFHRAGNGGANKALIKPNNFYPDGSRRVLTDSQERAMFDVYPPRLVG